MRAYPKTKWELSGRASRENILSHTLSLDRLTGFKASVYETEDSVFKSQSGDHYDDYSNNFNSKLGIYLVKNRRVIYGRLYRKW